MAISQGVGVSLATGVRTLLPPLLVGALARADVGVDFNGTDYAFLESVPWLAVLVAAIAVVTFAERRRVAIPVVAVGVAAVAIGALVFAGSLADEGYAPGPGLAAGAACAASGFVAARAFFGRAATRARAGGQEEAASLVELFAQGAALVLAALAVLVSPVAWVAFAFALWVLLVQRRRAGAEVRGATHPPVEKTKLVLVVVDAFKPSMLERAVEEGQAPTFAEILRRGRYVPDCVSVFPSVTPAASATITTGAPLDRHGVPSIDWYHRGERRYVDYGSSGQAVRTFGVLRTITDIVYNMNFDHLSRSQPTFFERLDDAGVRTACTPFLIFRGRTRHELRLQGWMRRVAQAANFRHAVYGPAELFYGELYTSREVDCPPTLARPGTRDPYSGCVGAFLERNDLYDFMLLSLPDNDHYSHRQGPADTLASIARADRHLDGGGRRGRRDGVVLLGPRRDPDGGPFPNRGRGSDQARRRVGRVESAPAQRPGPLGGRAGGLPGRALGDGLRAARRAIG